MNSIASKNIYSRLIELSDLDFQRKLWLNENNDTGMISSYVELMCSLYDDFRFEEFIESMAIEEGLQKSVVVGLTKLNELLNNYVEKESDGEIIEDPKWITIVRYTQTVIEEWDRCNPDTGRSVRNKLH